MANWHARDICGILLLLLVFTEAARQWAFVKDLSDIHIKQMTITQDSAVHPARRLLEPQVKPSYQTQALCRTEQECEDGVGVTCMQGNVVACSCDYIAACFPNVKKCSVYNSTHIESCGF
ncbi:hypothetical protein M758_8G111700 [Ceratodon purpureus]|uniref:Uncharacterized protein n=1 Tax=Ceratodon purpureus TaxID=3225 RepID=A0A8T0H058_CERPU|nr:hypothetical protein KC19_8G115500 [Ceratodon purpureus]KAG0608523.1 hypothetical protein M758_8G111700 [Ceratodon purpureus]